VVSITVQNLVGVDALVLIICKFQYFATLAGKRLFTPLGRKMAVAAILRGWGIFPPKNVTHRLIPKKERAWAETRHLSHKT